MIDDDAAKRHRALKNGELHAALTKTVMGAIKCCIDAHGPIERGNHSLEKRIRGAIRGILREKGYELD